MVTLKEVIQYRIHVLSQQIANVKESAKSIEKDRTISIDPKHGAWPLYIDLKQQASNWLTAITILKHFGKIPAKTDLRKAIRKNPKLFRNHLSKGDKSQQNALIFSAYQALLDTELDLKTNPSRFAEAEKYAETRKQEAANAVAAR